MAAKLRRYCDEELAALDQRIGVLMGDANLQGEANPFSPQAICSAFKQTCRGLEPNMKARMILHKLFDDHVLDDIRPIFKELNTLLVERSILPKIRYGLARHSGAGLIGQRAQGAMANARAAGVSHERAGYARRLPRHDGFRRRARHVRDVAEPGGDEPGCGRRRIRHSRAWVRRAGVRGAGVTGWAFPALALRERACRCTAWRRGGIAAPPDPSRRRACRPAA